MSEAATEPMRRTFALVRAGWRTAASYRLRLVLSIVSLLVTVVPLYFVANALQPIMAGSIAGEGDQYFGFLIVGLVTFLILPTLVNALPNQIASGVSTGTLDAILSTPSSLPAIVTGLIGFDVLWTLARAAALLLGGWVLGAELIGSRLILAAMIVGLVALSYLPFGLIAASMVIAFRTSGPLPQAVIMLSALLGGVYYPTTAIPSWIRTMADYVPLTYGLRALRATVLEGAPLTGVIPDLVALAAFTVILFAVGSAAFVASLQYARRAGTLAHL